jgi:UDP-galactopyranose mutase
MSILIVGAGLSGCVLAEQYAKTGKRVVIMEKRRNVGGNCYDYIDSNGILINKYGAHIFHTNSEKVWAYINQFAEWKEWKHKVYASYKNKLYPMPMNIKTVNDVYNVDLSTEQEMRAFLDKKRVKHDTITNSEQLGLSRYGKDLYEMFIEGYTMKQWNRHPSDLDESVVARIPIRYSFEETYFSDKYQALPVKGYTKFCMDLLSNPNIELQLSANFDKIIVQNFEKVFYTGPIDAYFVDSGLPKLEYRSLRFKLEQHDVAQFQKNSVINYTEKEVPYTRICEYKHFLNQKSDRTTIVKEYPSDVGEPYYPVPNPKNRELYEQYRLLAEKEERERNVYFVGRLANYKYFNMDEAILNALELFERLEMPKS